jgi:hypothetical protein
MGRGVNTTMRIRVSTHVIPYPGQLRLVPNPLSLSKLVNPPFSQTPQLLIHTHTVTTMTTSTAAPSEFLKYIDSHEEQYIERLAKAVAIPS